MMTATGVQALGTVKGTQQNIVRQASVTGVQINKAGQNVQVGKALLPIKTVTARVNPTTVQKGKVGVTGAPKAASRGRPRTVNRIVGAMTASAATNTVASALQSKAAAAAGSSLNIDSGPVKKALLTNQSQAASKSDSETELARKNSADVGSDKKLEDKIDRRVKV